MREREFWQIINGIRDENPRAVSHNLELAVSGMSDDKLISFIKIISSDFYTVMHTVRKRRS